ncbi:MAG: HAD family hydrolase [Halobacteriota archaeon]
MSAWAAVFLDIGGVILDLASVRRGHRRFVETLVARHGVDVDPEAALATWREAVGRHFRSREGTAYRSAVEAYGEGVAAVLGDPVSEEEWRPLFDDAVFDAIAPMAGAVGVVEALAERDLHLGIISDIDTAEGEAILDRFGIHGAFDSVTTSEMVGATKPDPAIFERALSVAGVDPVRSLMVGDRYEHDILGAADAGMRPVAFGAADGPAVAYRIESLDELLAVVDGPPRDG